MMPNENSPGPYTLDAPGAFDCFFTGTGCYAGDLYSDDPDEERGARELAAVWKAAPRIKRGKGYSVRLVLPSIRAAVVLAEYAEACLTANGDEPDYSEVAAARTILERLAKATGGRVTYNGFYVELDGRKS